MADLKTIIKKIANILFLNASYTDDIGLLNGKMGIAIFFYFYSRYTGIKIFEEYAGELIDEICDKVNTTTPVNFSGGLTGIGWGIEYLNKNRFIHVDTDEVLEDIDRSAYTSSLYRSFLLDDCNDLFAYGFYYISRLCGKESEDDNLDTIIKKQHLIYLTDDCERILVNKSYLMSDIQHLSLDTFNSLLWFLLEMERLELFPVKVKKILACTPEYIESYLHSDLDTSGKLLLASLTKKIIEVADNKVKQPLQNTLKKYPLKKNEPSLSEKEVINIFTKMTWQNMIYDPYFKSDEQFLFPSKQVLSILNNTQNWNNLVNDLNKENMGLSGLAGLGLGLLYNLDHIQTQGNNKMGQKMMNV